MKKIFWNFNLTGIGSFDLIKNVRVFLLTMKKSINETIVSKTIVF